MWTEERGDLRVLHFDPMKDMPFYSDWLKVLLDRGAAVEMACANGSLCGKCYRAGGHILGCTAKTIEPIRRLDQRIVLREGKACVLCIGCGMPVPDALMAEYRHFTQAKFRSQGRLKSVGRPTAHNYHDNIRIGGRVQIRGDEEPGNSDKTLWVRWKPQPVYQEGLGCADCHRLFDDAKHAVMQTNKDRERYAQILARLDVLEKPVITVTRGTIEIPQCKHFSMTAMQASCSVCARLRGDTVSKIERKLPGQITPYIDVFARQVSTDAR